MSDTIVISSAPPHWRPLVDITYPTHKAWCDNMGYDYYTDESDLQDNWYNPYLGTMERLGIAGFRKVDLLLHRLPLYKYAIWLDADLVITNPRQIGVAWGGPYKDIVLPYDYNGHNATVMGFRSTQPVMNFLWAVNNTGRKLFLKHDWKEMEAMRYFLMTPPYNAMAEYQSAKSLCPLLAKEYEAYVPTRTLQAYAWAPGDWSLHLSALPLERRIELAREYAQKALS